MAVGFWLSAVIWILLVVMGMCSRDSGQPSALRNSRLDWNRPAVSTPRA